MKHLLYAYPRWWRKRYGDELLALVESEPLTWRMQANVVLSGFGERLGGAGRPQLRVLWAWSLFVIGGMAFQKTSEHWQVVVSSGDRALPTAAFDTVQAAAIVGSVAVLVAVALTLPALLRDLRSGGWTALRQPILAATCGTIVAAGGLTAVAISHNVVAISIFIAFALFSLFAWTHAATLAARRLPPQPLHTPLAFVVTAMMLVITVAAALWFASVTTDAPSFVGAAQLAVMAAFMLAGTVLATGATLRSART